MMAVTWVGFFVFQKYEVLLRNLNFVKAGLSRKPGNLKKQGDRLVSNALMYIKYNTIMKAYECNGTNIFMR